MKTNTIFYTLLIALFSLAFVSCDENDELTVIDEMSKLENDSTISAIQLKSDCKPIDDPLPDTIFIKIKHPNMQEDVNFINHLKLLGDPIIDPLPDTTFLELASIENL